MALMHLLGVKLGFGFSAGLFDYVLNFGLSTRPWLLLPVGAVYALLYYTLFRFFIRKLDLATPGREREIATAAGGPAVEGGRGAQFVAALGGADNLTSVDACTTRLRLIVADQNAIDDAALTALGARGIIRPSANAAQVVLGPLADLIAEEIRGALGTPRAATMRPAKTAETAEVTLDPALVAALGGPENILSHRALHGRLRVAVAAAERVDATALTGAARGVVQPQAGIFHILLA
jgi:PTS system N-acetylglucosamine-specific IIC component